jgi:hypothetical protein
MEFVFTGNSEQSEVEGSMMRITQQKTVRRVATLPFVITPRENVTCLEESWIAHVTQKASVVVPFANLHSKILLSTSAGAFDEFFTGRNTAVLA